MKKVVINVCFGGFGLSPAAQARYAEKKGMEPEDVDEYGFRYDGRDDPVLVEVVEELGDKANGMCAELSIVEIPDDVEWHIHEYDGTEHIAENHRTWR